MQDCERSLAWSLEHLKCCASIVELKWKDVSLSKSRRKLYNVLDTLLPL